MRSEAATVEEYLEELPEERRQALEAVREVVLQHLPEGFEEAMNWGMVAYQVPLETYPDTYNGQPLLYAALANQKNHMALYLHGIYADQEARRRFEEAYKATGKRFDAGKSCLRFRELDDLPLPVIAEAVAATGVEEYVQRVETARARGKKGRGKA